MSIRGSIRLFFNRLDCFTKVAIHPTVLVKRSIGVLHLGWVSYENPHDTLLVPDWLAEAVFKFVYLLYEFEVRVIAVERYVVNREIAAFSVVVLGWQQDKVLR